MRYRERRVRVARWEGAFTGMPRRLWRPRLLLFERLRPPGMRRRQLSFSILSGEGILFSPSFPVPALEPDPTITSLIPISISRVLIRLSPFSLP